MEGLHILDRFCGGGWRSRRAADARRNKALCHSDLKAPSVAARARVPDRVGDPLCADGGRCRPDLSDARLRRPRERTAAFSDTVGVQLPLERHFLQFSGIWACFHLVGNPVGADRDDDVHLQQDGSSFRVAANPLPDLGAFCRIPELWRLAVEWVKGVRDHFRFFLLGHAAPASSNSK